MFLFKQLPVGKPNLDLVRAAATIGGDVLAEFLADGVPEAPTAAEAADVTADFVLVSVVVIVTATAVGGPVTRVDVNDVMANVIVLKSDGERRSHTFVDAVTQRRQA